MNSTKKFYCVATILALLMTGCSKPSVTSDSTKQTSQSTPTTAQTQTSPAPVTSSTTSSNTAATSIVSGKAIIDPKKAGAPIKAAQMFVNNEGIYYISAVNNKICFINKDMAAEYPNKNIAPEENKAGTVQLEEESASELLFFNNAIYYTNGADKNKIYSINADGKDKKKLLDESARNVIMMGIYFYYINSDDTLSVFDTGSGRKYSLGIKTRCFDSDGTNIYYEAMSPTMDNTLNSTKIDGSGQTILKNDSPTSIAVQDGQVIYANGSKNQTLYGITTDGKNRIKLADAQATSLRYSNGWIYYINTGDLRNMYKVQPDGSGNTKVINDPFITSFVVDNGAIYFIRGIDMKDIIYKVAG